ncbi:amino acid transporter, partial [Francisella tularensis subsp. holarctica]|nr:amino acid transporter [Francisella tularensis subsp. holarctica]
KLKISSPLEEDQYEICKGSFGPILMALLGCFGCLVAIIFGFITIDNMEMSVFNFDMMLIV